MNARKLTGIVLAAAAAGLFAAAPAVQAEHHEAKVKCAGANACKGKSECATASNACKGMNGCKGKGMNMMSGKDCKDKGGKMMDEGKKDGGMMK